MYGDMNTEYAYLCGYKILTFQICLKMLIGTHTCSIEVKLCVAGKAFTRCQFKCLQFATLN